MLLCWGLIRIFIQFIQSARGAVRGVSQMEFGGLNNVFQTTELLMRQPFDFYLLDWPVRVG